MIRERIFNPRDYNGKNECTKSTYYQTLSRNKVQLTLFRSAEKCVKKKKKDITWAKISTRIMQRRAGVPTSSFIRRLLNSRPFQFQAFSILGLFNSKHFQFQAFPILGLFNSRSFQFQAFSILGLFNSRPFQFQAFSVLGLLNSRPFQFEAFSI